MRLVEINISTIDYQQAMSFWESSPHSSAFTSPELCDALGIEVTWLLASKGTTPFVLWPVVTSTLDSRISPPAFSYYFGPMWSAEAASKSPTSSLADSQACYVPLLKAILREGSGVGFELNPLIHDVRIFDWWNYGEPENKRFKIRPRYSARIYNLQPRDPADILGAMRKWRRIEVRRSRQAGNFEVVDEVPMSFFSELRAQTLANRVLSRILLKKQ